MAKTYNHLFEKIIGFDDLYNAYLKARRGKRKSWPCRVFERDLEAELIQLQNELIWGEYQCGPYRSFHVSVPKRRKITALQNFRDRVVQNAVVTVIEPIWERRFIQHTYACRAGKGTHSGANTAQTMLKACLMKHGKVYALKADISKYFASIDHSILKTLVRKRISDNRLLEVIDNIIDGYHEPETPGIGLPIGNLTSQLFANIYLDALDQFVKCRKQEKWYIRYMDDFVVVHSDKSHLQSLRLDIERFLSDNLHLSTNHKTSVFPIAHHHGRGLDFLGFHLWPNARRLRKASLKRFRQRVRQWQSEYTRGEIEIRDISEQMHSWTNHARHGNALPAIEHILSNAYFRRPADVRINRKPRHGTRRRHRASR